MASGERLRLACDACHAAKARCSKGMPCSQCAQTGAPCIYSPPNPLGRPKGSKSKQRRGTNTAQSIMVTPNAVEQQQQQQQQQQQPPPEEPRQEQGVRESTGLETSLAWKSWLPPEDANGQTAGDINVGLDECLFGGQALLSDPNPNSLMASLADRHTPHTSSSSASPAPTTFFTQPGDSNAPHGSVLPGQHVPASMAAATHFTTHVNPPSPESALSGQPTCSCVAEHVRLLYRLQHGNDGHMTPADFLATARQALDHWNTLLLCNVCSAQHDQHPWLLSVMSMRALTRLRHRLPESRSLRVVVGTFDVTGEDQQAIVTLLANKANERLGEALVFTERLLEERSSAKQP